VVTGDHGPTKIAPALLTRGGYGVGVARDDLWVLGGPRIGDPHARVDAVDEHGGGLPGQRGGDPLPAPGGCDAGVQLGLHLSSSGALSVISRQLARTSCSACETKSAAIYAGSAESSASTPILVPPQSVMPPAQAATAPRMQAY
jgi:hypothetical protein